jgi:putative Holliday junction resolvase
MKILAIDYGTKRVGLAVADTDVGIALPLKSVPSERAVELAAHAADAEGVHRLVVGMPASLGDAGTMGERAMLVKEFIERLRAVLVLPIDTEDERMTTALVERMRRDAGIKKSDFDPDAAAATAILETYLERLKSR